MTFSTSKWPAGAAAADAEAAGEPTAAAAANAWAAASHVCAAHDIHACAGPGISAILLCTILRNGGLSFLMLESVIYYMLLFRLK